MSSHREAPEISKDPVADNTDVYAFVSPDSPDTVTLITNYIPLEEPAGGPNFYEFGDDVLYEIHIDNNGDAIADITYQFRFKTQVRHPDSFLYNSGPITSLDSPNWNRRQLYSITKVTGPNHSKLLAENLVSPPCNIGPRSTPNYAELSQSAVHTLPTGERVFAGQRDEGFFVDLGAVFDLLDLRPFQNLHLIPTAATPGLDGTKGFNVHTIAIQVPKKHLTSDGSTPTDPLHPQSVIGVWGSASRRKALIRDNVKDDNETGPWVQVSRLANPLFNEVIVPLGKKDLWNRQSPKDDKQFLPFIQHPELARLIPTLYPGVFPNLAALKASRDDLVAILLTGIPKGLIPGFQNFTGKVLADMLRLNMAIPPTAQPNNLGLLGGDLAGFPNGRRIIDDTVTIELRARAGVTYPLINKDFKPDAAASKVTDGAPAEDKDAVILKKFPYLGVPNDGFDSAAKKM
ncbi:MAG TPA: DUF4331 domain-containing protein [Ktedonobacteraceae bacterium]|jgi:hypothetical protein|nr:DUF4331 domain-containing protein [Ktedonobacteraceae bacterium]